MQRTLENDWIPSIQVFESYLINTNVTGLRCVFLDFVSGSALEGLIGVSSGFPSCKSMISPVESDRDTTKSSYCTYKNLFPFLNFYLNLLWYDHSCWKPYRKTTKSSFCTYDKSITDTGFLSHRGIIIAVESHKKTKIPPPTPIMTENERRYLRTRLTRTHM